MRPKTNFAGAKIKRAIFEESLHQNLMKVTFSVLQSEENFTILYKQYL